MATVSWCIALFEYLLQVPANRIGHSRMSIGQLNKGFAAFLKDLELASRSA